MVVCSVFGISVTDLLRFFGGYPAMGISPLPLEGFVRSWIFMASTVELTLRYTTVDVHCRDRTDECDRGIKL